MSSSISIWLNGGLGNQLFMLFATMSYAIDNNLRLIIYSNEHNVLNGRPTYWDTLLERVKHFVQPYRHTGLTYHEPGFEYSPIPPQLAANNYTLSGYYQSYKYFEHNYAKIRDLLGLDSKITYTRNKYEHYFADGEKNIAMHFRLNDYLKLQDCHPVQPADYYLNVLYNMNKDLREREDDINNYNILYFFQEGDEAIIEDYLSKFKMEFPDLNFVQVSHNISDWEQMLLMASCDHFIIPNSTFSWFAAYFCNNKDKIVYYPGCWFGPAMGKKDIKDLCPPDWNCI
jgi:hypothetical protein